MSTRTPQNISNEYVSFCLAYTYKDYFIFYRSLCHRLSVMFVRPTQAIEIFRNVSRHLVQWPSVDIRVKFYRDRPRRTPPSEG